MATCHIRGIKVWLSIGCDYYFQVILPPLVFLEMTATFSLSPPRALASEAIVTDPINIPHLEVN